MKRLQLLWLCCFITGAVWAQNTTTLPSGTIQTTPQFRIKSPADSLREIWINFPFYGYNRLFSATELGALFKNVNSLANKTIKRYTDSLYTVSENRVDSIAATIPKSFSEAISFTYDGTNNKQPLTFKPEETGEIIAINGEVYRKGIDYYFKNDSLCIVPSNLVNGIEYNVQASYQIQNIPQRTGVISFIFDDGKAEDDSVVTVMDQYGYKCGFALVTNGNQATYPYNVRKAKYLDYQTNGYEILSHSITHAHFSDTTQISVARHQFQTSYDQLTSDGFHVTGFVTPYNTMDPRLIPVMKEYYRYGFTAPRIDLPNHSSIHYFGQDIFNMTRNSVEFNITAAQIKEHIDKVIATKGYTCFYAHKLGDIFKKATFNEVLTYVQIKVNAGQLQILPPGQAIKKFFTYK